VSKRERAAAAAVVVVLHLILLGPLIGDEGLTPNYAFQLPAEGVLDGQLPYEDLGYEYPPLSLPVVIAPALISESFEAYRAAFEWEMFLVDIGIILMLALALPGGRRRVLGALAIYGLGVVLLSNLGPLPDSDIDKGPLAFARFDLLPGALILAAGLARLRSRSATWSSLLSAGVAVKFFPVFLYPSFLRDEPRIRRALLAAIPPLALAAAIVVVPGDEFGSAISYHTGRDLQIESLGATPHLIGYLLGRDAYSDFSGGAFNIIAGSVSLTRTLSIAFFLIAWAGLVVEGWRRRVPPLEIATAILAVMILFAPVLSPQFLFWVLPVSAAAYGLRPPNLLLLLSALLTQVILSEYSGVASIEDKFVISITLRNAALLAFTAAVILYAFRRTEPDRSLSPQPAPA
jgi:hypothetical protein